MATESSKLYWERISPDWWSSCVGYIRKEEGELWSAYLYHNTRVVVPWTERKPGFRNAGLAKRWIESEAED